MGNKESKKGKPSKAVRSRHAKYARYAARKTAEFNAARVLKRHLVDNPNDGVAQSKLSVLKAGGFA